MDTSSIGEEVKHTPETIGDGFLFLSPFRSLVAEGCFAAITAPAVDGHRPQGEFQREIAQAFKRAKNAGIARPLVVGAIPFDTDKPSALYIPERYRPVERTAFAQAQPASSLPGIVSKTELPAEPEFIRMVEQGVAATRAGELDKVVLSRLLDITTQRPVDIASLMARVIAQNPTAYHFHVPLPDGALFGASPELLLRKSGQRYYSMPLAGSARRDSDAERDAAIGQALLESQKDRYEHRLVIEGMREVLSPRSVRLEVPATPELTTTATLWHLATAIQGVAKDASDSALSLACLLHPTPALCGAPTEPARRLIQQLEPFDRELFGGIVGWCDEAGNGEWVVTIRCGRTTGNRVRLFAGAGIVPGSTPVSEWNETGVKLATMLRAFGLN